MSIKTDRSITIWLLAAVAVLFGLLTIWSGGAVLFIDGVDRQVAGDYVSFVLWFNFLAGFAYVAAGAGLWRQKQWAVRLSVFIVSATLIVYAAFALYILDGGAYEMRTVVAMSLRSIIWVFITIFAYRKLIQS